MTPEEMERKLDALASENAALRRRLTDLEESVDSHVGIDYGATQQLSPHPNIQVATVEYGGGVGQLNADGIDFKSTDSGDALTSIPTGAAISWYKDLFSGTKLAEIGGGYSTPGVYTFFSAVVRAFAGVSDASNVKIGTWNETTNLWTTVLAVQDGTASLSPLVMAEYPGGVSTTIFSLARTDGDNMVLSMRRGATLVEVGAWQGTGATLTIATGAVTVTSGYHVIDTESAAATDDLDTINGGITGKTIVLSAADGARSVVFTEAGNMKLAGGTFTADNAEDTITLIYNGSNWLEMGRSDNGA